MCNFKSALVIRDKTKKGGFELFLSPWTESHSTLMRMRGIKDGSRISCARVEFSPPTLATAHQLETYKLKLDEERTPSWWTQEIAESVAQKMAVYINSRIITGDVAILIGDQFILAGNARIESAQSCIITAMSGSSVVNSMYGSSVVEFMSGSSVVNSMYDSSVVKSMSGSSIVESMSGSSVVKSMYDSSVVESMSGSSIVKYMYDSSVVKSMSGSSVVKSMYGSSQKPTKKL